MAGVPALIWGRRLTIAIRLIPRGDIRKIVDRPMGIWSRPVPPANTGRISLC